MFDRFVVVDWSANSTPKRGRDSIWIAVLDGATIDVVNPATRAEAENWLGDLIAGGESRRTLIGIDASLGYPSGTAAALGLASDPWRSIVGILGASVVDEVDNTNNRFAVAGDLNGRMTGGPAPFWGCPPRRVTATLMSTKPSSFGPVAEWRSVESVLRKHGHRPFSSWQLLGAGAVGSQQLLALPMIERFMRRWPNRVDVWPLTTGLGTPAMVSGSVVIAEVWPSMLDGVTASPWSSSGPVRDHDRGVAVRDELQVRTTACWLAELDARSELARHFDPTVPPEAHDVIESEEGWVLGVSC